MGSFFSGSDDGISRLTITSHKKLTCTDEEVNTFEVQMNPENVEYSFGIEDPKGKSGKDNQGAGIGTPGSSGGPPAVFSGYQRIVMDFKFYADATGIVPVKDSIKEQFFLDDKKTPSIRKHLDLLQNTVYGYEPEVHGPPYLKLVWGNIFPDTGNDNKEKKPAVFKGTLESCTVKIVLFSLKGEPVKAEINLKLKSEIAPEARPMGNSPDITHHVDISHGDKMTMHCERIYGRYDSKICSAVAEYNNLIDWDLKPESKMVFPSIHLLNQEYLDNYEDMEVRPLDEQSEYEQMVELIGEKRAKQHFKAFPFKTGEA
ncbi:hypothetical protein [Aureispira sp. CCB-E]|uniref:CIS tube protein n=1 Tax=Aureispira sp. CCB-E TaxID=3051121 RepID=UPI002868D4E3|nr:hypothetical protein [Aureispira sp. CCB-E]WMX14622.1 hypothetical protein QP953_27570 [Aureispira sp. CCB-E]